MSLRDQLNTILPEILPASPKDAMKGTELIRLIRLRIDGNYSDASLRYHFSIMSCDPSSTIAKVEHGQGYYRRSAGLPALAGAQELLSMTQGRLEDISGNQSQADLALLRMLKFRAIVQRWSENNGRDTFLFSEPFQANSPMGNLWKFPEMVMIDWQGLGLDGQLDPILKIKQHLQLPPFILTASRLRIQAQVDSIREDFFQALSASAWANGGELFYACAIDDEALSDALRKLSAHFGIGITCFGLGQEQLDDLPRAEHILNAHPRETEALMERLDVQRIAAPKLSPHIDWSALESIRSDSPEIDTLFQDIQSILESKSQNHFGS
ncbi:hypothetical protein [Rubritalea marina]|uniref:hypothetical protein n=1 Tax=Rubritalea marina TaxID=361055 RepID=UPI0003628723|nr:hypothetical protein [Rubritalea marina]